MSEEKQKRHCLWCHSVFTPIYKHKLLCSQACHTQFHYIRQRDFSYMTPSMFKKLIIDWLSQDVPDHPNVNHPAHILNQQVAEVYREATVVMNVFNEKLQQAIESEGGAK